MSKISQAVFINLLLVVFSLCSTDYREVGGEQYSLCAVFRGRAALVELVSIVELILAGGIGEVWHRV